MANGGIRDHVGGGFHRYAVDERWIVPHLREDGVRQLGLLHAYLDGYAGLDTHSSRKWPRASGLGAGGALDEATGAFYTSQDADVAVWR